MLTACTTGWLRIPNYGFYVCTTSGEVGMIGVVVSNLTTAALTPPQSPPPIATRSWDP